MPALFCEGAAGAQALSFSERMLWLPWAGIPAMCRTLPFPQKQAISKRIRKSFRHLPTRCPCRFFAAKNGAGEFSTHIILLFLQKRYLQAHHREHARRARVVDFTRHAVLFCRARDSLPVEGIPAVIGMPQHGYMGILHCQNRRPCIHLKRLVKADRL